ncbi:MAG: hypothetical protein ACOYO1_02635 [Bacteroidales bacterium]
MKKKTLKTEPLVSENNKIRIHSLLTYDLPTLIENMKKSNLCENDGFKEMILLNRPEKQVVLTSLQGGVQIKSFQSNDSITFHIIEGKLKFSTKNETVILNKGQFLALHDNIKYKLIIKEETVLLLTIANETLKLSKN